MKFVCHTPQSCSLVYLASYSIGEVKYVLHVSFLYSFNLHGLFATLDMYSVWTEKEYSQMCTNMSL